MSDWKDRGPKRAIVWEDSGPVLMARILGNNGSAITQASISSIALAVHDKADGSEVATATPVVADTVFDSLQTSDTRWTEDATGYNFKYEMDAAQIPHGSHDAGDPQVYQVEIVFTPTSGAPFPVVFELDARGLYSS